MSILRPATLTIVFCLVAQVSCLANAPFRGDLGAGSGDPTNDSENGTTGSQDINGAIPFAALSPEAGARKVKTLLTGQAATADEYALLANGTNALQQLVKSWMATQGYATVMQRFFLEAFQQNFEQEALLELNYYFYMPSDIWRAIRDSFPMTVMNMVAQNQPFTNVATTRSFLMNTAMMAGLAFYDMTPNTNYGEHTAAWMTKYPNLTLYFQDQNPNITTDQSTDPNNPNFGIFYYPGLSGLLDSNPNCSHFPGRASFAPQQYESGWTYDLWRKWEYQGVGYVGANGYSCQTTYDGFGLQPNDYTDWRLVTVRMPNAGERPDTFMQVDRLRSANTLILSTPFVGYFTTLPFRAMWQTNVNNQSRVTINQAMIVGLGAAFDGKNGNQAGALPGLDASHSVPNSPCYSCHRNLDPMRMFYQHDLDNYGAPQTDSNITSIVPTFVFNTAPVQGHSLYDLGSLIAQNSGFGPAWVQKLCVWANSAPCSTTDPEFIRLTNLFVQSNYSWNTLVENLMVSPLITYAAPTATANSTGGLASLSRRNHLCHTLNTRLGLTDLCQQQDQYGSTTGSVLTTSLPADTVLRGSVHPAAPTATTMAFRTSAENLCLTAVSEAVKASSVPQLGQSDPNVLVDFLVSGLMGLSPKESNTPSSLLLTHYQQALAAATVNPTMDYSAPDAAMRSTFVVACLTPYVTAIGF